MIRAIAAIDDRRGIAKNGQIPWNLPADRKFFKEKTMGGVVLMGRGTYETLSRPLPGRTNLVLTHQKKLRPGFLPVAEIPYKKHPDLWIIGGEDVYQQALPYCQELYLTHVPGDYSCDQFFPDYKGQFELKLRHVNYIIYKKLKNRLSFHQ